MRRLNKIEENSQKPQTLNEFKSFINNLISNKKYNKFKFSKDYFNYTNNQWLIEKYIAKFGKTDENSPENTLQSYENAIKSNYAITIPVQMLKDGNIVCFKDRLLSKLTNTSGYICNYDLEELKKLCVNNTELKIPTLEESLDFIDNRTQIIVEIINIGSAGKFEDKIINLLDKYQEKYNTFNNVAIMSINPYTLEYVNQKAPYYTKILKSNDFKGEKYYGALKTKKLKKLKFYKITMAEFICLPHYLLPNKYAERKSVIGIIANNIYTQDDYINTLPYCDNIIFQGFIPKI